MNVLALPDASVDAIVSRFGLLMFGDVPASARELARVLRAGCPFSLAVGTTHPRILGLSITPP